MQSTDTSAFARHGGELYAERVPLASIAERFGTPCFVYSRAQLVRAFQGFEGAFGARAHLICYAVKANSTLAILNLFARLGAGFDIVSGGELERVIAAGGDPAKVVFSGVGKRSDEIELALVKGILCFNVESQNELARISSIAAKGRRTARISLRVNPDVDPLTHPHISTGRIQDKFGVPFEQALDLYRAARALPGIEITGVDCHTGSQITALPPFLDTLDKLLALVSRLEAEGIHLRHLDLGGGLGIRYRDETPPDPGTYVGALLQRLAARRETILLEPGRALVGNAGILLTRVEYLKAGGDRDFAVIDAAMNDLVRPVLYDAYHAIIPVRERPGPNQRYEVVGPICESADFLGHDRELAIAEGDLLAVMSAGAYGMSMSSNYNTRPRACEVMVDGDAVHLVRERESVPQLFALERPLPGEASHGE